MLHQYLSRLYATIYSRGEIEVERFCVKQPSMLRGRIAGRLRFYDGSTLEFEEILELQKTRRITKVYYKYHYQHADGTLVFRYDNAPHHPEVPTFPDHLHIEDRVEAAEPPDLSDVLRKIDGLLYPTGQREGTPDKRGGEEDDA